MLLETGSGLHGLTPTHTDTSGLQKPPPSPGPSLSWCLIPRLAVGLSTPHLHHLSQDGCQILPPPRQCLTPSGQAELGEGSDDEGIFLSLYRQGPSWDPSQSQRNPRAQHPASLNTTPDPDQGSPSLLWVTEALAAGYPDLPSNCSSTSCHVPGTILGIRKKAKETQGWQARARQSLG